MALFEGLPETALIQKIIYWRTVDTGKLPKEEKKYVLKMRKLFSLKERKNEPLTVEELNKQSRDRVAKLYAEAERKLKNQ